MKITSNCIVSIHYTLTSDEGEQLDSSDGQDPLVYLHGAGNIISGLEQALVGKAAGEELQVVVQPQEGYGLIDPDLVQSVPRTAFEGVDDLQPGMQFQANGPEGQVHRVTIREVGEDSVSVDGNHPLAGRVLHFEVRVEGVREATEEEIEHGHAH